MAHFITAPIRCAEMRMRVLPQRCSPLRRVLGVAPAGAVQRKDRGGGFLERRYAPSVATLGERVTACPRELAVDQRHVTRFSQRHDRVAAEPERPGCAAYHEPLHPAPRA